MKYPTVLLNIFALVIVLFLSDADADDKCKKLKDPEYELYGTKTIYDTARRYLNKQDEDDLPKSFDDDSLEKEHNDLVDDYCTPVAFYFIGRHSARFPDGEDIEFYNEQLNELKENLKRQEFVNKCPSKFNVFLNWTSKMQPKHDNLITDIGGKEERDIARRFKRIYPEFFDTEKSDIKVGVTTKIRTAQTGAEFLKEVDGFRITNCDESSLPTNDLDKPGYDLDRILKSACYKAMMDKYALPFLEFHKDCENISGKTKIKEPLIERVKDPNVVKEIAERVSKKLGLPTHPEPAISYEMLNSIFNVCKFENAFKEDSVWCSLFEKKDVKALEYIEDVNSYIKSAYGPNVNTKQSCPLIKDLVENFHQATQLTGSRDERRKSYFYFSHADPMKRLLAAFGVFEDDDSFSEDRIQEFATKLKVDKDREWRSSLIVPFSANMAFIMYRCQKPGKSMKHKILTTVTEKPVKLGGCKDTQCSSQKFFDTYNNMRDCDLNKICGKG